VIHKLRMSEPVNNNQKLIVSHAVLAGLTPLIPIPVIDDLLRTYFVRRLVRQLGAGNRYSLSEDDIKLLADEPESGCLAGCLTTAFILPFKLIFRKLFYFLEWKRAVDTVSRVYYHGYLVDCALSEGWCYPAGPRTPLEVRAAIDGALDQVNTKLLERTVQGIFNQSKSGLKSAASLLERSVRRKQQTASIEAVGEVVEEVEEQEKREIEGITKQLQNAIARMPSGHFQRLREDLAARLGVQLREKVTREPHLPD
jgi:hypothetical protein